MTSKFKRISYPPLKAYTKKKKTLSEFLRLKLSNMGVSEGKIKQINDRFDEDLIRKVANYYNAQPYEYSDVGEFILLVCERRYQKQKGRKKK